MTRKILDVKLTTKKTYIIFFNFFVVTVGLEHIANTKPADTNGVLLSKLSSDSTPTPMELEPDTTEPQHTNGTQTPTCTPQVDLELELREFLEGGNSGDDVGIEQMLME